MFNGLLIYFTIKCLIYFSNTYLNMKIKIRATSRTLDTYHSAISFFDDDDHNNDKLLSTFLLKHFRNILIYMLLKQSQSVILYCSEEMDLK